MEFCEVCENLLTIHATKNDRGEETIVNFCHCCNNEYPILSSGNTTVFKKDFGKNKQLFKDLYISKYTKHDPTLPTINIDCPNCDKKDVVFVRTNEDSMSYLYLCRNCDTNWENEEK